MRTYEEIYKEMDEVEAALVELESGTDKLENDLLNLGSELLLSLCERIDDENDL